MRDTAAEFKKADGQRNGHSSLKTKLQGMSGDRDVMGIQLNKLEMS